MWLVRVAKFVEQTISLVFFFLLFVLKLVRHDQHSIDGQDIFCGSLGPSLYRVMCLGQRAVAQWRLGSSLPEVFSLLPVWKFREKSFPCICNSTKSTLKSDFSKKPTCKTSTKYSKRPHRRYPWYVSKALIFTDYLKY